MGAQTPTKRVEPCHIPDFGESYVVLLGQLERLNKLMLDLIKDEFERLGVREINPVQALLLFHLGDQEMSAGDMRARGLYQGSNVSYNLKKLVGLGYLHYQRSQSDRRTVRVRLTSKGILIRKTVQSMTMRHARGLYEANKVTDLDLDTMCNTLEQVGNYWSDQIRFIY